MRPPIRGLLLGACLLFCAPIGCGAFLRFISQPEPDAPSPMQRLAHDLNPFLPWPWNGVTELVALGATALGGHKYGHRRGRRERRKAKAKPTPAPS